MNNPLFFAVVFAALFPLHSLMYAKTLAEDLAEIIQDADTITIVTHSNSKLDYISFSDRDWIEKFASIIAASDPKPQKYCWCKVFPQVLLFKDGSKFGTLSIHHREKLRASTSTTSGDFFIGTDSAGQIIQLINSRING